MSVDGGLVHNTYIKQKQKTVRLKITTIRVLCIFKFVVFVKVFEKKIKIKISDVLSLVRTILNSEIWGRVSWF